jgi:hypothetical protein
MEPKFSAFELAVTALVLDRKLVKQDRRAALELAHEFLSFADSNRGSFGELGFVAAVQTGAADVDAELAKAKKGEPTDKFVRMNKADGSNSELHKLLKEYGANAKLLARKFGGQLTRLKEVREELPKIDRFELHPREGSSKDDPFRDAVIIHKDGAIKYAKHEIKRAKEEATAYQQKYRRVNPPKKRERPNLKNGVRQKKSSAHRTTISR